MIRSCNCSRDISSENNPTVDPAFAALALSLPTESDLAREIGADVDPDKLMPLFDEMMTCIKIVRDARVRDQATGEPLAVDLVGQDDIEEISTVGWLRSEVLRIHSGFSASAALSALISAITRQAEASSNT